ncbi:glycosyltransferase [Kiritimatiellota bacterium B12222]|nr:glycosyltransferase [Kiritimatiellota bacterium B12222]
METRKISKVALLFRYGLAEHVDFLPALPQLIRKLNERGMEVHHFGFRSECPLSSELRGQVRVHEGLFRVRRASEWDKRVKALLWLLGLPFLGWRLQRQGFERVFVDETLPLSAPLLRMGFRGKLMFTVHDFFIEIYWEPQAHLRGLGRVVQAWDLHAWRKLTGIFTRVDAAREHLISKGVDADRIAVVPDPVDLQLFHPLQEAPLRHSFRQRWGIEDGDVVMVHHGIMHPNKGNLFLVEAMDRLRDRFPQLKLLLIGDGAEMSLLQENVAEAGLQSRIILTGWLPGLSDISVALQASDIGLVIRKGLPGDHFHVTSTLVHNMACGLPIVAARLKGVAGVVEEGAQGWMFEPEDAESFDAQLTRLIEDPKACERMGKAARQKAEDCFDPEGIAEEYCRWLCE